MTTLTVKYAALSEFAYSRHQDDHPTAWQNLGGVLFDQGSGNTYDDSGFYAVFDVSAYGTN